MAWSYSTWQLPKTDAELMKKGVDADDIRLRQLEAIQFLWSGAIARWRLELGLVAHQRIRLIGFRSRSVATCND